MDMLRKLVEEKMRKGVNSQDEEQDSKKKTAQLGVLSRISEMAEGAMADDMKNDVTGHNTSSADPGTGMSEGVKRAEQMVNDRGNPLRTDVFDDEESTHGAEESSEESPEHEASESPEMEAAEDEGREEMDEEDKKKKSRGY